LEFVLQIQPFLTVTLTNCAAEGKFSYTGIASCVFVAPTVAAVTKLCTAKESKTLLGSLRFGTEPATMEGTVGAVLYGANAGKPFSANL
jgi:hypothetical protein